MTMLKTPTTIRILLALAALAAIAVAASGCGTSTADEQRGRVLFVQKCGVCHAMAQAGTTAQIGPNLDDAFAAAREAGEGGDTIEGIVKAQVEFPRPSNDNPAVSMPADVVTDQDLEDVAAYVGRYAGVPGAAPPEVPGGPAPRSSPTTAAAAATRSPPPTRAASPVPTSTKCFPARPRR